MQEYRHVKYGNVKYIYAGDYDILNNYTVITVLGSCISICLIDRQNGIAGINHYLSPRGNPRHSGDHLTDALLREMRACGAKDMVAKVFGGASSFQLGDQASEHNIKFAYSYLSDHGIPIVSQDVGGKWGRKLVFMPNYYVYVKYINYFDL